MHGVRTIFFALAVFLGLMPVAAQEAIATESVRAYRSQDGAFSFAYPENYLLNVTQWRQTGDPSVFFIDDGTILLDVIAPTPRSAFNSRFTPDIVREVVDHWQDKAPVMAAALLDAPVAGHFQMVEIDPKRITRGEREIFYATQVYRIDAVHSAAALVVAVEVGADHIVILTAIPSLDSGAEQVSAIEQQVLDVAASIHFTPQIADGSPFAYFSGEFGIWQKGNLTFSYPVDWYAGFILDALFLMNTSELSIDASPLPGQVQVRFVSPDYNLLPFADEASIVNCSANHAGVDPVQVIEAQMIGSQEAIDQLIEQQVAFTPPEPLALERYNAAVMHLYTPERDMMVIAVDVGGHIISMTAYAVPGEMVRYEEKLAAVANSLEYQYLGCTQE